MWTIVLRNRSGQSVQAREHETILEAATRAGIALQAGCLVGGCRTCAVRVVRGSVSQPEGIALPTPLEQAGVVLACVARPTSDVVVDVGTPDTPLLAPTWLLPWTD